MILPKEISEFNNIKTIEKINKGYSEDLKYYISDLDNNEYLLKISSSNSLSIKQQEFYSTLHVYNTSEIPMSRPINFYHIEDKIYTIFSWCKGDDLYDILPSLSSQVQYELGFRAGSYLNKIHSSSIKPNDNSWYTKFKTKKNKKIDNYNKCPIKFNKDKLIIDYLNNNEDLLLDRPQVFHHGDFHPGNMIYDKNNDTLYIIDFNRFDFGDPFEEFNRIDFAATISPPFARGQIDGYFNSNPPQIFFDLLLYYISSNAISSIPWAIPFGKSEVNTMLNKIDNILYWFDDIKCSTPTWYFKD